jgi:exonuclease SbcD
MKLLHTSDWHVGKTIKGHTRIEEHREVLTEIVGIAEQERVDLVLVVGDLFESAAPTPDAQSIVWEALLGLRNTGAKIVVVAGNHDNHLQFRAIRPVMDALGITMLGDVCPAGDGGLVEITTKSGELARLALLPFCSQRYIIKAAQLMTRDAAANVSTYAERVRRIIEELTRDFEQVGAVNVVLAHCMVRGGKLGGGEREAQTFFEYFVDPTAFPGSAHYVALGHLHRTQQLPGACPIWYSGSPIQVDFGEEQDDKHVVIVEASPGNPAKVLPFRLSRGRRLRTIRGTLPELRKLAGTTGDDWLRIFVQEHGRAGLADEIYELLPLAIGGVEIDSAFAEQRIQRGGAAKSIQTSPHELFAEFLAERQIVDERLNSLFAHLLDEETSSPSEH